MPINVEVFSRVFEACRQHRHEYVDENHSVIRFRVNGINYCPLTLAARHFCRIGVSLAEIRAAADALGLSNEEAAQIVSAADARALDNWEVLLIRDALFEVIETPNMLPAIAEEQVNAD